MNDRPYQKLVVWKIADELCLFTHKIVGSFPSHERYNLIDQMRRSAYSIPTNIVEGNARWTAKDKRHFFTIALASLEELHYQYSLAFRLKYFNKEVFCDAENYIGRVSYLLRQLRSSFPIK